MPPTAGGARHRCSKPAAVSLPPFLRGTHPISSTVQIYTADVGEYIASLHHMLAEVRGLSFGKGTTELPDWLRRLFRDLLAAFMCAPGRFKETMRPTRSAYSKNVHDPRAYRLPLVTVTIKHKDQWWSRPPAEWHQRIEDYMHPERIAHRELCPVRGTTAAAAPDVGAEATAASRSSSASMRRRWEQARAAVCPCAPPLALLGPKATLRVSFLAFLFTLALEPSPALAVGWHPSPRLPLGCVRSVTKTTSPPSRTRTSRTGLRST